MKDINADSTFEDIEITDYPYLGIGRKPVVKRIPSEEELERIIGG